MNLPQEVLALLPAEGVNEPCLAVRASAEFQYACPASAVAMMHSLA